MHNIVCLCGLPVSLSMNHPFLENCVAFAIACDIAVSRAFNLLCILLKPLVEIQCKGKDHGQKIRICLCVRFLAWQWADICNNWNKPSLLHCICAWVKLHFLNVHVAPRYCCSNNLFLSQATKYNKYHVGVFCMTLWLGIQGLSAIFYWGTGLQTYLNFNLFHFYNCDKTSVLAINSKVP